MHFSFVTVSAVLLSLSAIGRTRSIGQLNEHGLEARGNSLVESTRLESATFSKRGDEGTLHLESKREPAPPQQHMSAAGLQHIQNFPSPQQAITPSSRNTAGILTQAQRQQHNAAAAHHTGQYREYEVAANQQGTLAVQHAINGQHGLAANHAAQAAGYAQRAANHRAYALANHEALGTGNYGHEYAQATAAFHAEGWHNMAAHQSALHAQQQAAAQRRPVNIHDHNHFPALGRRSVKDAE